MPVHLLVILVAAYLEELQHLSINHLIVTLHHEAHIHSPLLVGCAIKHESVCALHTCNSQIIGHTEATHISGIVAIVLVEQVLCMFKVRYRHQRTRAIRYLVVHQGISAIHSLVKVYKVCAAMLGLVRPKVVIHHQCHIVVAAISCRGAEGVFA